jgi:hypothetical protein
VYEVYRDAPEDARPSQLIAFHDARDVEIAARCCREWLDEDTLDPDVVPVCERIVYHGMQQLPRQAFATLLAASVQMDVKGSHYPGYEQLKVRGTASMRTLTIHLDGVRHVWPVYHSIA